MALPPPVAVIDGHAGRRASNALTITFVEAGQSVPLAKAQQGAGDGLGKKFTILLGLKNYAPGTHVLTWTDTSAGTLIVPTRGRGQPTMVTRGDGSAVATITRGTTTRATLPDGSAFLEFGGEGVEHKTDDRYRLAVTDARGDLFATVDLVRTSAGWDGEAVLRFIVDPVWSMTRTGGSMPMMFRGTRLVLYRAVTSLEREVLLAACLELGICARAYTPEMGQETAWG